MKASREAQHLLLPAGEVAGGRVPAIPKHREQRQCGLGGLLQVLRLVEVRPAGHLEALRHAQVGEDAPTAWHLHDAEGRDPVGIETGDVLAVEDHLPGGRAGEPRDRAQQRGLAGAVRPEHRDELPVLHVQVDPEEHGTAVVAGVDRAQHQEAGSPGPAGPADFGVGRGGDPQSIDGGIQRPGRRRQYRGADQVQHDEDEDSGPVAEDAVDVGHERRSGWRDRPRSPKESQTEVRANASMR